MMIEIGFGSLVEPFEGRRWDRRAAAREIALRTGRLRDAGLADGERVLITFGNRLEFFAELMAVWRSGGCAIPIDPRLTAFETGNLARSADARFAIVDDTTRSEIADAVQRAGARVIATADTGSREEEASRVRLDADALILFTSGSTGEPKGVVHTHRSLRARWMGLRDHLPARAFARSLCMLPTHFGHGLICNCLYPWLSGNELHVTPPFQPDHAMRVGAAIDEHGITFMSSVPPMWKLALRLAKPPARGTLQRVHVGSAPLSAQLWEDIRRWTGTRQVCNAYGITETGSWVAGLDDADVPAEDGLVGTGWGAVLKVLKPGAAGAMPDPGAECATDESGLVWINTPALMTGYFRREDLTDAAVSNGWFLTGDVGAIDARGRLFLRGRQREEINRGGMKIYPADIDAVVERHAGVRDVCAFAIDDSVYGEVPGMAVVLADAGAATVGSLLDWMKLHLAEQKMPAQWWAVDAIPRTSRGKVNRNEVRAACRKLAPLDLPSILARRENR
jgi:acyl-CoA synthetase (AMP-forming)/AMP-acid ligase II